MLTNGKLKELLDYNQHTGIFIWKTNAAKNIKMGTIAGSVDSDGYICIGINKKLYLAHRLAWLYIYNELPKNNIDHINGIKNDNRISNLKDVSQRQNGQNRKEHRNNRLVGCYFNKNRNKWQAQIKINKNQIYLGLYNTEQEAHDAYIQKIKQLEGEYK